MKIAPRDAAKFVSNPPPSLRAVLVYGENTGLVRDLADALAERVVPGLKDSERLVDLAAADLRRDPARLSDEACQMSMFSPGRRVIRIRDATEGMGEAFADFLAGTAGDALVVAEAAELSAKASLRVAFEQAPKGAAIACYEDAFETLVQLAHAQLSAAKIECDDGALELLIARTGSDRRIIRKEADKIAVFFGETTQTPRRVSKALIDELLGQSGEVDANEIAAAAAMGDHARVDRLVLQAEDLGGSPAHLVTLTLRHFHALLAARAHGSGEGSIAIARSRGLWGQSDAAIGSQLRLWTLDRLAAAVRVLGEAEAGTRNTVRPEWPVASRALLHVARLAR
jgi:DNA polymerase-3 subunit delta